jgi:hypothetical protein
VSQNWFGESERTLATLILGMSNPLGLVLGQSLTPLLVTRPDDIPLLNLVWFLPALPGFFLTVCGVRSSLPPTPPSPSAASAVESKRRPFLGTIAKLCRNRAFWIIFMFLGGAMGYISTLQTKLEQVRVVTCVLSFLNVFNSVADPDPGYGVFLTPDLGSGIGFRIPDLGSRNPDTKPIFLRAK